MLGSKPIANYRPKGCDINVGDSLLKCGSIISPSDIGLAASQGFTSLTVFQRPTVAIMSTGNEVLPYDAKQLPFGKIRDSNRPMLMSLMESNGFNVLDTGVAPDEPTLLLNAISKVLERCDLLITSGGVSMGEHDLLKQVLVTDLNFVVQFAQVHMKPGKPTTFCTGIFNGRKKFVFALPGNPVSTWVTSQLFVIPALRKMSGMEKCNHTVIQVKANGKLKLDLRPEYHRAMLSIHPNDPIPHATSTGSNQMSSRLVSTTEANLLLVLPPKSDSKAFIEIDDVVDALVIGKI